MKNKSFFSRIGNLVSDAQKTAKVDVWAMCYERIDGDDDHKGIGGYHKSGIMGGFKEERGAEIINLRTGEVWETDEHGYAYFKAKPGPELTLAMIHKDYATVQGPTVKVPPTGLTGRFNEMTFQTPTLGLYNLLMTALKKPDEGNSHIVSTIQKAGYNMHIDRGMDGARVYLYDEKGNKKESDLYLGQLFGLYTDWFNPIFSVWAKNAGLDTLKKFFKEDHTSLDGAAMFLNTPPGRYIMRAEKPGYEFTEATVDVIPNLSPNFINVSPPHSPHVIDIDAKRKEIERYNSKPIIPIKP